jgi:hypothetical protein
MSYANVVVVSVEPIDGRADLDEWLYRAQECMATVAGYSIVGHKQDMTTAPFIEVSTSTTNPAAADTQFLVLPTERGLLVAAGTREGDQPDPDAMAAWAQVARDATAAIGSAGQGFDWTALIGPPYVRISGDEVSLSESADVGPFHLSAAGTAMWEILPPQHPSLMASGMAVSWPILVEGRHEGYSWPTAGRKVAFDLNRLAGLLSLSFGHCLVVREGAAPLDWGVRQAPERIPWQRWPEDAQLGDRPNERKNPMALPNWVPAAWQVLQDRPAFGHALDAYHEGLRAQLEHPSLALVAFIAAIEGVANTIFTVPRCDACGGFPGVAARFREALRIVCDPATSDELGRAYSPRSRTVHRGQLHGSETRPGAHGLAWSDPVRDFEYGALWGMRKASADLLRRALRSELPEKRSL